MEKKAAYELGRLVALQEFEKNANFFATLGKSVAGLPKAFSSMGKGLKSMAGGVKNMGGGSYMKGIGNLMKGGVPKTGLPGLKQFTGAAKRTMPALGAAGGLGGAGYLAGSMGGSPEPTAMDRLRGYLPR